ncbi:MAG: DUF6463 family protein [Micrococcales bacterium]|nr:DUF6463 family protein [Micrococcales bacterium]
MTTTTGRSLWRHVGALFTATGLLHVVVFTFVGRETGADIVRAGMVNAIGSYENRALFWYGGMLAGAAMVLVGLLMTSWVRATGRPVPRYVGWTLVGLGVVTAVLQPLSGGVLVIAVGLVALSGPRTQTVQPGQSQ